jgi:hypothetical protein
MHGTRELRANRRGTRVLGATAMRDVLWRRRDDITASARMNDRELGAHGADRI